MDLFKFNDMYDKEFRCPNFYGKYVILTLKAQITTAADDTFIFFLFINFHIENKSTFM